MSAASSNSAKRGAPCDDVLPGLRVTGFQRRMTIGCGVTAEAALMEGVFHGGQYLETVLRNE